MKSAVEQGNSGDWGGAMGTVEGSGDLGVGSGGSDGVVRVCTVFGTRPEIIKLVPVIRALEAHPGSFHNVNVSSGQHGDLLIPFIERFGVRVDHDLRAMQRGQSLNELCARILKSVDEILAAEQPDVVLVQGDTTTALAAALAAFDRQILVGHVEAGLRSGDRWSPFPEEMNRRVISRLANLHFAPTAANRQALVDEGIEDAEIHVTGNTVIDALQSIVAAPAEDARVSEVLRATEGLRRIVLTTHRRESFGERITAHLEILKGFVARHPDVALIFPVHPNPVVVAASERLVARSERIHLIPSLPYEAFIQLLGSAWLVVSDSGGVQEEAPSLGKPLLVLRDTTDRQESIQAGVARLVGESAPMLESMLEEAYQPGSWVEGVREVENPFGRGDSAERIREILARTVGARVSSRVRGGA